MGKKRIAIVGDAESEEKAKLQKEVERKQKKLRGLALKGEKGQKDSSKTTEKIHVSGLKGGERIKSLELEIEAEAEVVARKLKEAEALPETKSPTKKTVAKKRGRNYLSAKIKVDPTRTYPLEEALRLLRLMPSPRFVPTVELHINCLEKLNCQVLLPHQAGRTRTAAVADEATLKKIESGKIDFDVLFATADQMPKLAKLAKVLGPRGLMPNPKTGTIVTDPQKAIKDFAKSTQISLKTESKAPVVHTVAGKLDLADTQLSANIQAIITAIKPTNIQKAILKSTMSPAIKLNVSSLSL